MEKPTKNQKEEAANLPAIESQSETGVNVFEHDAIFDQIARMKNSGPKDKIELTSSLLQLEEGEEWAGVMTNQMETLQGTAGDGVTPQDYEAIVMYDENRSKILCADAVVISTAKKYFEKFPNQKFVVVYMINKGDRKSAKDAKRIYRDIKIFIEG